MPRPIRTLIADDEGVIREGLRAFLELDRRIEIIGEAINGQQAIQMAIRHQPDILILDSDLSDITGTEVVRQIHATFPTVRVICLAHMANPEPSDVACAIPHVSIVLSRSTTSHQLLESIHCVMNSKACSAIAH